MSYLVDVDLLIKALLANLRPGLLVVPEADVDTIDELPIVIYSSGQGRGTSNGRLRLAQIWPISFTVLAAAHDGVSAIAAGKAVCDDLTEAIVEKFPRSRVAGVGACTGVDPVALFSRTAATALGAKDVSQFNGAFELLVQPLP